MFDLETLVYADKREIAVKDPQGRETAWRVWVAGPNHPAALAARDKADARARDLETARAAAAQRGGAPAALDPAETRGFYAAQVADRIVGWSDVRFSGEDFPFSAANALRLMTEPRFGFVAMQIVDAVQDLQGFMPPAKPS